MMATTNQYAHQLISSPLAKDPNIRRVLRSVWKTKGISRIDLAAALALDKSTITKIVSQLMDAGLVFEAEEGEAGPSGGRKPVALQIRTDFGSFLGIEIQTERFQACLIDPLGSIIASKTREIDFRDRALKSVVLDAVAEARESLESPERPLLGIGLGLSGIIDADRGIVRRSLPLSVSEPIDIASSLGGIMALPLRIENDARCCCWSELIRRRFMPMEDFMFILGEFRKEERGDELSRGVAVGMGFVLNGMVHRGNDGTAGEFRSVFRDGPTKSQFSLPDEVIAASGIDNAAFEKVAQELGLNVGLLVNMLDLRQVVVGGVFDRFKESLSRLLCQGILRNAAYPGAARCDIVYSELGEGVVAYGAAAMLANRLFAEPSHSMQVKTSRAP